ncbi:MAG: hypothetical protein KKF62_18225 [Bacteroidetes bacterium]|nr:hypothetical protein [Bacteroidota bacterium]MBU1115074.1 hypothetical protein [Bacteroidota bacterium]MBU1797176.1 hypothetical protein [Bacteroidota bacterium]
MKKEKWFIILILLISVVFITSCVPGGGSSGPDDLAGFFLGIWHGWIAPISLILGLFNPEIRIYEIQNSGWWYDFGFYMAIISGFGGLSFFRKNKDE